MRTLVFVGYAHASESPWNLSQFGSAQDGQAYWLAGLVKTRSGIDPLTIDQTVCAVDSNKPMLVVQPAGRYHGRYDLHIGHPVEKFENSRPTWRHQSAFGKAEIPQEVYPEEGWTIVEVRREAAVRDTVPYDRVAIMPSDEEVVVFLPDGPANIIYYPWPKPADLGEQ